MGYFDNLYAKPTGTQKPTIIPQKSGYFPDVFKSVPKQVKKPVTPVKINPPIKNESIMQKVANSLLSASTKQKPEPFSQTSAQMTPVKIPPGAKNINQKPTLLNKGADAYINIVNGLLKASAETAMDVKNAFVETGLQWADVPKDIVQYYKKDKNYKEKSKKLSSSAQRGIDFILQAKMGGMVEEGAVKGNIEYIARQGFNKLTKNITEKAATTPTYYFSPSEVQAVFRGTEKGLASEIMKQAGKTSSEWRSAVKNGVKIELNPQQVISMSDKPYWAKLKNLIGMESESLTFTIDKKPQVTNIAGLLSSGEELPAKIVTNTPLRVGDKITPEMIKTTNPVPSSVVQSTAESKMYKMKDLISVKNEPETSLVESQRRINDAMAGKMDARKPIEILPMQNGKYLVVDGNATYQALLKQGYTDIPAIVTNTDKLKGRQLPNEAITKAAQEHFTADAQKKEYGKLFGSIANELGLKKVNPEGKDLQSDVKTIVGILDKRHVRNVPEGQIGNNPVNDILRDTIIINKPSDVAAILTRLREKGYKGLNSEGRIEGLKNRYIDNTPGYKDANYQFVAPDGQIVELQMMQQNMYDAKTKYGHYAYDLKEKFYDTPGITDGQKAIIDALDEQAKKIYAHAYTLDNPSSLEKTGSLANASNDSSVLRSTDTPLFTESDINSSRDILKTLRQASSISLRSATENFDKKLGDLLTVIDKTPFTTSIQQTNVKSQPEIPSAMNEAKVIVKSNKKLLTGNEVKAIQGVIETKLERLRITAANAKEYQKGIESLYNDITERSKGDKSVLSALRMELNKEMFGIAGAGGNYKEAYATLKQVQKSDPEVGAIIDSFETYIQQLDDTLVSTPDTNYQLPAFVRKNRPVKQTGLTGSQDPVGTGKLTESRAYKRLLEKLEDTDPQVYESIKDNPRAVYNKVNQEYDFENAAKLVETNPEKAYRIAMGIEPPPVGQRQESISLVLADRAFNEGNTDVWLMLEKSRSLRQTRRGQEIVAERGRFNENSPHRYVNELLDRRLKKIGKNVVTDFKDDVLKKTQSTTKAATERIKTQAERVKTQVEKIKKTTLAEDLQGFIDELICK